MGQSLFKIYAHIVFSTKHRQPFIIPPFDAELYKYIGGTCKNLGCNLVIVGGYLNHVHILSTLSKTVPFVKLIGEIKAHSSKWMKTKDKRFENFYWQDGYGAFSVNPDEIDVVKEYIIDQYNPHSEKTFEDEYREFLLKYQIDFDERYVWD